MACGGGGGHVSGLSTGRVPLPLQYRSIALADCTVRGGGGGRGEHFTELKNIDKKNTLLFLPPSLSSGAGLVRCVN